MTRYTYEKICDELLLMKTWQYNDNTGKLYKLFIFNNFKEAFQFMSETADYAEEINHHPEWCNVFKKVEVNLVTHDADGITSLDFDLAKKMDSIEQKIGAPQGCKLPEKSLRGFLQHTDTPVSTEALCKPVEYTNDRF